VQQRASNPQNILKRRERTKKREGTKPKLPQKEENLNFGKPILFFT